MLFSVVIPTYNRNDLLAKCIDSILAQSTDEGFGYEIIVSDDSKNEMAKNLCESKSSKWVKGLGEGPAANRNNGAKYAKGEWLVFIDDDCIADKNLLKEYYNSIIQHPDILAFEGAIIPDSWKLLKKDLAECPINTEGGCFWSANICMGKNLFKSIGGFNEHFRIAAQEDQQLKIDIEAKHHQKIFFVKKAVVAHPVRFVTIKKKLQQIPIASKNFCMYAQRNKQELGYTSVYRFIKEQSFTHLRNCFYQLKSFRLRNFIVALAWLSYGLPLNVIHFYSLQKSKRNL